MEVSKSSTRMHPLVATAAASVILVSLTGVAAITGLLPNSHGSASKSAQDAQVAAATTSSVPAPAEVAVKPIESAPAQASKLVEDEPKAAPKRVAKETEAPVKYAARPAPAPKPKTTTAPDYSQHAAAPQQAPVYIPPVQVAQAPAPSCYSCGRVEAVNTVQSEAAPSGLGAVAGGVVGGLLGNQVGDGRGKTLATVAGAVGGGYAGHQIEKRTRSETTYQVRVRMEDGKIRTFPYNNPPSWSVGDRVKVVDGYLTARG